MPIQRLLFQISLCCIVLSLIACSSGGASNKNVANTDIVVLNSNRAPIPADSYTLTFYNLDPKSMLRLTTFSNIAPANVANGNLVEVNAIRDGRVISSGIIVSDNDGGIVSLCDATNDGIAQISDYSSACLKRIRQNHLAITEAEGAILNTQLLTIPAEAPSTLAYVVDPGFPPEIGSMPTGEGKPSTAWKALNPNYVDVSLIPVDLTADTRTPTPVSDVTASHPFFQKYTEFDCKNASCPALVTLTDTNDNKYPLTTPSSAYYQSEKGVNGSFQYPYFERDYQVSIANVSVSVKEIFTYIGNGNMQLTVLVNPASSVAIGTSLALPTIATRSFTWHTATSYNLFDLNNVDGVAWMPASKVTPAFPLPPKQASVDPVLMPANAWSFAGGMGVLHQNADQIQATITALAKGYADAIAVNIDPFQISPSLIMATNLGNWHGQLAQSLNQELAAFYNTYTMDQYNRGLLDYYPRGVDSNGKLVVFANGITPEMLTTLLPGGQLFIAATGFGVAGVDTIGQYGVQNPEIKWSDNSGAQCAPVTPFTLADFAGRVGTLLVPSAPENCKPSLLVIN